MATDTLHCDLCHLEIVGTAFDLETPEGTRRFCCRGCRQVYGMVEEKGLQALVEAGRKRRRGGTRERVMAYSGPVEQTDLAIQGMWCSSCAWLIERGLEDRPGVIAVEVSYATERAVVHYDPSRTRMPRLVEDVKGLGYRADEVHPEDLDFGEKHEDLVLRFGVALVLAMFVMGVSLTLYMGALARSPEQAARAPALLQQLLHGSLINADSFTPELVGWLTWLLLGLSTPIVFFSGAPLLRSGLAGLRHGAPNMDSLIVLGALTAWGYSLVLLLSGNHHVFFDTAAMIITLILAGRLIELNTKRRSFREIRQLLQMGVREARLLAESGEEETVPVERVQAGDRVIVKGGETVPVDGVVIEGASELDESLLTGESLPVRRAVGERVTAGSLNRGSPLLLRADAVGPDTVLGGILRAVNEAQNRKAPIQRLVDRIAALFIPAVVLIASGTVIGHILYGLDAETALLHGLAVLVIACPCALGLATPKAIYRGTARAAAAGLVVRGGEALQVGAGIDTVLFDKTGTITEGRFQVVHVEPLEAATREDILGVAAALERRVEHPIARALVDAAEAEGAASTAAGQIDPVPGAGVSGTLKGVRVMAGGPRFLIESGVDAAAVEQASRDADTHEAGRGWTLVFVARGQTLLGWIALTDRVRAEAAGVVEALRTMGCRIAVLSGDRPESVRTAAGAARINDALGGLSPEEKIEEILRLQAAGYRVAMVGDGINDGPALAQADLGIAVGTGADLALETADVAMLRADLRGVPALLATSKATMRRVHQNLFLAFFYNVAAIPLAVLGILSPITAAAAMALSSVTVTLNSVRPMRAPVPALRGPSVPPGKGPGRAGGRSTSSAPARQTARDGGYMPPVE